MKTQGFIFLFVFKIFFGSDDFLDPTGTYILKAEVKNHRIVGHSGEIRVKLLDRTHLAISFYITRGYPNYESGAFMDTLPYKNNIARYTPTSDPQCNILILFSRGNAEIQQVYSDPTCHCGFGEGILVSAYFEKSSGDMPIIQDLSGHGKTS
jgi:hypothetical protein